MTTTELYALTDALLSKWVSANHLPADVLRKFQDLENKLLILHSSCK